MSSKLYESEKWMRRKYLRERLTPEQIATICGVTPMTIYRAIKKFNLKR